MSNPSMRLWAGLFVLVVFVAGLAAGVLVSPGPPRSVGGRGMVGRPAPDRMTERLLDRTSARLDLTEDQEQRLRAVFDGRQQRLREINEQVRERFETQQAQMNAEIAAILTPEQMEIFENEILSMRQERGRRGGFGRGGRGRSMPGRGPGPPP
jgi:Spy/CpxP family protein refolding chaperone